MHAKRDETRLKRTELLRAACSRRGAGCIDVSGQPKDRPCPDQQQFATLVRRQPPSHHRVGRGYARCGRRSVRVGMISGAPVCGSVDTCASISNTSAQHLHRQHLARAAPVITTFARTHHDDLVGVARPPC
jgi:hypothetical protein